MSKDSPLDQPTSRLEIWNCVCPRNNWIEFNVCDYCTLCTKRILYAFKPVPKWYRSPNTQYKNKRGLHEYL